jgi:uncharacterized phage infection (PIP) family protein YhgE
MNDEPTKDKNGAVEPEVPETPEAKNHWPVVAAIFFFCVMVAGIAYAVHERAQAAQISEKYGQMDAALSSAQTQMADLATKLKTLEALRETAEPVTPSPVAGRAEIHHNVRTGHAEARTRWHAAEDPRWKKVQSQLDDQQKQIAAAQQNINQARTDLEGELSSTHDELNGSIAKNHDQLVALAKRGERNFYEFDLTKSRQFARVGPIGLALRKANTKHSYCDFNLLVDDSELNQKHVSLYQPVEFYPTDYGSPVEVVIYKISKNEAKGYVSAPKYRQSELSSQQSPSSSQASPQPASNGSAGAAVEQPAPAKTADLARRPAPASQQ